MNEINKKLTVKDIVLKIADIISNDCESCYLPNNLDEFPVWVMVVEEKINEISAEIENHFGIKNYGVINE